MATPVFYYLPALLLTNHVPVQERNASVSLHILQEFPLMEDVSGIVFLVLVGILQLDDAELSV